jgi:SAM-dependent methyltransferase
MVTSPAPAGTGEGSDVLHPECDLRRRLADGPERLRPYTADRIRQSYPLIAGLLADCAGAGRELAWDVGCGAGFDSFALGMHFGRVVAVDTNRLAIREARELAGAIGATHVGFDCVAAERYTPPGPCDLVFCNLMSHNASSRVALLRHLAAWVRPGGYLFYSEIAEGYAPMEGHRAIQARNAPELEQRCRQVLNGFLQRPGFRFFLSGTGGKIMPQVGLTVVRRDTLEWRGVPYLDKMLCRRPGTGAPAPGAEVGRDYVELDPAFVETGARFGAVLAGGTRRLHSPQREQVQVWAGEAGHRFAPYLIYLLIADAVLPALGAGASSLWRRLAARAASRLGRNRVPDWSAVQAMDEQFLTLLDRETGRGHAPAD